MNRRVRELENWRIGGLAVLLGAIGVTLVAQTSDRTRVETSSRRATERLQALQREADQLAVQERTLLGDLRKLELERQIKAEDLKRLTAESGEVSAELITATDRIATLERTDLEQRPELRARLVDLYKLGQARYLRLLLSTSDLRQLGRASRMVAALAQADRDRIAAHQRTLESLNTERQTLQERQARLQTVRADAERVDRGLASAVRARADLIAEIDRQRDLNAQLAGELLAAQQKLQATLRDLSAGGPASDPSPLPIRSFKGALDWPLAGTVRRRFGRDAATRTPESSGIEIAATEGTPVLAVHEGNVAFADPFAGFGNLVIVDHGGQTFSLYGDLMEVTVKRGARVDRGQAVGTVGTSPTGPAGLYFEIRVDGKPADPLQWLKRQ